MVEGPVARVSGDIQQLCWENQPVDGGVVYRAFPSILDEEERLNYKQEFDQDHHEYKSLQAELDGINQRLAELDTHMNTHPEGSPQFLVS